MQTHRSPMSIHSPPVTRSRSRSQSRVPSAPAAPLVASAPKLPVIPASPIASTASSLTPLSVVAATLAAPASSSLKPQQSALALVIQNSSDVFTTPTKSLTAGITKPSPPAPLSAWKKYRKDNPPNPDFSQHRRYLQSSIVHA